MKTKIIVVSDNHGRQDVLQKIVHDHFDADAFLHCGDTELPDELVRDFVCVKGNNDYYSDHPYERTVTVNGLKILLSHSHQHTYYSRLDSLAKKAKGEGCSLVCYGHTNRFYYGSENGISFLNPGSVTYPRDGKKPCYAVITFDEDHFDVQRVFLK